MKYSILLCLLLVLVNSKIEPKSFLTKFIKNFSGEEEEDYYDDDELCDFGLSQKQCKNNFFPEEDLMCYYFSAKGQWKEFLKKLMVAFQCLQ